MRVLVDAGVGIWNNFRVRSIVKYFHLSSVSDFLSIMRFQFLVLVFDKGKDPRARCSFPSTTPTTELSSDSCLTLWRARQLYFFYVQIPPELKNRFVLKGTDLICWRIIKVKILLKISGMKFSCLEFKSNGFAVKPPRMKGLKDPNPYLRQFRRKPRKTPNS